MYDLYLLTRLHANVKRKTPSFSHKFPTELSAFDWKGVTSAYLKVCNCHKGLLHPETMASAQIPYIVRDAAGQALSLP